MCAYDDRRSKIPTIVQFSLSRNIILIIEENKCLNQICLVLFKTGS